MARNGLSGTKTGKSKSARYYQENPLARAVKSNYDKKLIHEGIKNLFEPSMTTIVNFKPELILNPNYDGFLSNKKIRGRAGCI